jgi:hypothetical protein
MAHAEDSWIERVKASGANPSINRAVLQADRAQLTSRHDPVLLLRKGCDHGI